MIGKACLVLVIALSSAGTLGPIRCEKTESAGNADERGKAVTVTGRTLASQVVSTQNEFGFKLFRQLSQQDEDKNIFISPFSVATALAMTYNGASGETLQAMAKTLGLEYVSLEHVNQANAELRKSLENLGPKVELAIANSLWARMGIEFNPNFLERNRRFYRAEIATLDFTDPRARQTINQWVDENTGGKIKEIVQQIDPRTVMFLINATYFKGRWQVEFDKSKTKDGVFNLTDGKQKLVPMMSQSGRYQYYQVDRFQAVGLPYGNGRIRMYIFLPRKGLRLGDFLKELNRDNWERWISQLHESEGDITLPRLKSEYEKDLNDALTVLGMGKAFDPAGADFRGIRSQGDLFVQKVKHKAVVEVNEEGTEASATTGVGIGITSVAQRFRLVVDRPFFYVIGDNKTDSILFMGAAVEPV